MPPEHRQSTASSADRSTVAAAEQVLQGQHQGSLLARLMPFLGPSFIASVAYMDPGNFATNIEAGAKYGYMLLWVVLACNLMAMLIQLLAAKLGIATGRNLAELCRDSLPLPVVWFLWILMEIVAMATDLAEFIGAALGFQLLLGGPLWFGGLLTVVATVLLLSLQRHGFRPLEAVITSMVAVVAFCYAIETILDKPAWGEILVGSVVPRFQGAESVLLAAGILGATVMPHAIFLHSSLTQGRIRVKDPQQLKRLFRFQIVDVLLAMSVAGAVNACMLIMSAAAFHRAGLMELATIEEAYRTLTPLLGRAASWMFGISLLAAGLSSTVVGTMSGQVIMQGFVRFQIPLWVRRVVTLLPSMGVILAGWDPTRSLVLSQVVLSFALPFAVVPLVVFTARRSLMGPLTNHRLTTLVASACGALIIALNIFLVYRICVGG
ncbi:MAG: Nramp family divalent metal transporter [Planctomycetota bacterium]|nr:Nramp family divalent metal transporter [Planctomycetota bacterium]